MATSTAHINLSLNSQFFGKKTPSSHHRRPSSKTRVRFPEIISTSKGRVREGGQDRPGTANSAVVAMEGGTADDSDQRRGAAYDPVGGGVYQGGDRLVGMIAKRFNGRKMNEVDEESKQVGYRVVRDDNGNIKLDCPAIRK